MEQVEQMDKGVAEHRREMKQYSSNDTVIQMIVLALLCIVSLQPLVGLFTNLNVPTQQECLAKINAMFLRKSEWIRYLGYLSLVVAILAALVKRNISLKNFSLSLIKHKPWNVCFLLLFLYVSFSTFAIAPLLQQALNGEEYRYEGFFSIIAYAGFFSLASLLTNEKYKRFWMIFTVSVSVVLGGCALYSYHSANPILLTYMNRLVRSEGGYIAATFIQYNHYAYYLCMMVVMAAGLFLTEKKRVYRLLSILWLLGVRFGLQWYKRRISGSHCRSDDNYPVYGSSKRGQMEQHCIGMGRFSHCIAVGIQCFPPEIFQHFCRSWWSDSKR